jgi:hypothetical protein
MPLPVCRCAKIKKEVLSDFLFESGAGEESRTLDLNLGKVALYQLSYSRISLTTTDELPSALHRQNHFVQHGFRLDLEREKSLELSTSTLARLRSTN